MVELQIELNKVSQAALEHLRQTNPALFGRLQGYFVSQATFTAPKFIESGCIHSFSVDEEENGNIRVVEVSSEGLVRQFCIGPIGSSQKNIKCSFKGPISHALMIFTCSPDEAEAAVGDLLEKYETVSARHSKFVSNLWFAWELSLMVIAKLRKRLVKATLGPLLDKFFKPKL